MKIDGKDISLHYVGKGLIRIDGLEPNEKEIEIDKQIDKAIDKYLVKIATSEDYYGEELPRLSEEERMELKLQIMTDLLKRDGVTDEHIAQIRKEANEEVLKLIAELNNFVTEHQKYVKNNFSVMNGSKAGGKNEKNEP